MIKQQTIIKIARILSKAMLRYSDNFIVEIPHISPRSIPIAMHMVRELSAANALINAHYEQLDPGQIEHVLVDKRWFSHDLLHLESHLSNLKQKISGIISQNYPVLGTNIVHSMSIAEMWDIYKNASTYLSDDSCSVGITIFN